MSIFIRETKESLVINFETEYCTHLFHIITDGHLLDLPKFQQSKALLSMLLPYSQSSMRQEKKGSVHLQTANEKIACVNEYWCEANIAMQQALNILTKWNEE